MQSSALINALWISLLGITVSVCTPLFQRWYVGDKIAFINTHFAENRPASNATRNRLEDFKSGGRVPRGFSQSWDFLLVDAASRDSFALSYGVKERNGTAAAFVSFRHVRNDALATSAARIESASLVTMSRHFDMAFPPRAADRAAADADSKTASFTTSFRALSADSLRLTAMLNRSLGDDMGADIGRIWNGADRVPAVDQANPAAVVESVQWQLDVHRVFGFYGTSELEEASIVKQCSGELHQPFAFDAEVEGRLVIVRRRVGGSGTAGADDAGTDLETIEFARAPRFRALASSSWGCAQAAEWISDAHTRLEQKRKEQQQPSSSVQQPTASAHDDNEDEDAHALIQYSRTRLWLTIPSFARSPLAGDADTSVVSPPTKKSKRLSEDDDETPSRASGNRAGATSVKSNAGKATRDSDLALVATVRRSRTGTIVGDTEDVTLAMAAGARDRFSARSLDLWCGAYPPTAHSSSSSASSSSSSSLSSLVSSLLSAVTAASPSSLRMPRPPRVGLIGSCSDASMLRALNVTLDRWVEFEDDADAESTGHRHGSGSGSGTRGLVETRVPRRIVVTAASRERVIVVAFQPTAEQYTRTLVPMQGGRQIRSDFLAVNVAARVIISKLIDSDDDDVDSNDASSSSSSSTTSRARPGERPPASAAMRVVFDRTVATLSAVQFSYVAPLRPSSHDQNTVRKDANEKLKVEL